MGSARGVCFRKSVSGGRYWPALSGASRVAVVAPGLRGQDVAVRFAGCRYFPWAIKS